MKLCPACGVVKPASDYYTYRSGALHPRCKPCTRERQRQNDALRRDEKDAYGKQYYAQNRDEINRLRREKLGSERSAYLAIHGERLAREKAERDEARRLKRLDYCKRYHEAKRAEILARKQRVYESGPELRLAAAEKERRKRAALRSLPQERYTTAQVIELYGTTCWICELPIDLSATEDRLKFTVDHCIPIMADRARLAELGLTHPGDVLVNVAPAHKGCNCGKNNKLLPEAIARYLSNVEAAAA